MSVTQTYVIVLIRGQLYSNQTTCIVGQQSKEQTSVFCPRHRDLLMIEIMSYDECHILKDVSTFIIITNVAKWSIANHYLKWNALLTYVLIFTIDFHRPIGATSAAIPINDASVSEICIGDTVVRKLVFTQIDKSSGSSTPLSLSVVVQILPITLTTSLSYTNRFKRDCQMNTTIV